MPKGKPWELFIHVHVVPEGDLRPHTQSPNCWCKPTDEWQEREGDGSYCIFTHNSADKREKAEHLTEVK